MVQSIKPINIWRTCVIASKYVYAARFLGKVQSGKVQSGEWKVLDGPDERTEVRSIHPALANHPLMFKDTTYPTMLCTFIKVILYSNVLHDDIVKLRHFTHFLTLRYKKDVWTI